MQNKIEDFIIDIVDHNTVILSKAILTEFLGLTAVEAEEILGEGSKGENLTLICHRDADLDDDQMVDASTYSIEIQGIPLKDQSIAEDLWREVEDTHEYTHRYKSY